MTLLVTPCLAHATDQLLGGRKLLIKNGPDATANRLVHLVKDSTIVVGDAGGTGDPRCSAAGGGGSSSLRIITSGGASDVTIPLPCEGWAMDESKKHYQYKDSSGATCRLILIKDDLSIKASCNGSQVAIDVSGGMVPVVLVMTLNTDQYCTSFGGTIMKDGSDGKTFLAKDSQAPDECFTTVTTTTTQPPVVCCHNGSACTWSQPIFCVPPFFEGGSGSVCNAATGSCTPPPASPGPCCQFGTGNCLGSPLATEAACMMISGGGTFFPSAQCTETGCMP